MKSTSMIGVGCLLVVLAAAVGCKQGSEAGAKGGTAITADAKGFTPSSVELKKGVPAVLTFTRTTDETCAREVVFPEIQMRKDLPLNTPVSVDVPVGDARTLTFQCGMGMYRGKLIIQ